MIVGGNEHQIKIVDLKQGKVVKYFKEHTGTICTVERINSKVYGECLLSQGMDGAIKLWSIQWDLNIIECNLYMFLYFYYINSLNY